MILIVFTESPNLEQMNGCGEGNVAGILRRLMLALLRLAMTGTFVDLMLLDHHEDLRQMIPLTLLGLAALTLAWHAIRNNAATVWAIRAVMILFIAGSVTGVVLHFRASAAFHAESDPAMQGWQLVWAVLQSKVPPTLAPAAFLQMGLMGLAYTYRHPALRRHIGR